MLSRSSPISTFGELADVSLAALPAFGLLVVLAVMLSGLVMWSFGGRLVKPTYTFVFAVSGAAAGMFTPPVLGFTIHPAIGIGLGALIGALAGMLLFRLSMATALGAVGGVLTPLIATVFFWVNASGAAPPSRALEQDALFLQDVPISTDAAAPQPGGETTDHDPGPFSFMKFFIPREAKDAAGDRSSSEGAERSEAFAEALETASVLAKSAAERLQAFVAELANEARAAWDGLPANQQLVLAVAAAIGALGGFVLGMSFPKKVAAIGSAFLGAGVWTPIAARLMHDYSLPGHTSLPTSARNWLALWLIVAAFGLALQWTVLRPKADKPSRSR